VGKKTRPIDRFEKWWHQCAYNDCDCSCNNFPTEREEYLARKAFLYGLRVQREEAKKRGEIMGFKRLTAVR
jgi:hypothetical protein